MQICDIEIKTTTIMRAAECPFCGAILLSIHDEDNPPNYQVFCGGCGARGPKEATQEEAVQAWNRPAGEKYDSRRED